MVTERQKALERAEERYEIDYRGILLNTSVSVFSSASATGITSFLTSVSMSKLPYIAAAIFLAQVVPKLLIELNKAYFRNKARQEAYSEGLLNDRFDGDDDDSKSENVFSSFISMCEHSSYY